MLHMILGILKITGIVIVLLLCFLLCTVLALLFVPVRYRVGIVKQAGKLQFHIDLSWMLRIVSAAVSGGRGEKTVFLIRLFGFRLPLFEEKKTEAEKQDSRETNGPGDRAENKKEESEGGRPPDDGKKEPGHSEPEPHMDDTGPKGHENPSGQKKPEGSGNASGREKTKKASSVKEKAEAFRKKLLSLKNKAKRQKQRLVRLYERPSAFLRMLREYEIKEILKLLLSEAGYLLEHYKPRCIRGFLRFGMGDPALTGVMTGFVYMLLPAGADQFTVDPDFYETVFETEIIMTGYLRAFHLIRAVLHISLDKKVRRAFQKLIR